MSLHGQASLRLGITDVMQDIVKGTQGTTSPSLADFTEQAMLYRVPFRSSGWVVADRNGQAQSINYFLLKVPFPYSRATTIAAPTIHFDHQTRGVREAFRQFSLAPVGNAVDGKGRRVRRLTDIDCALIVLQVIDTIGNGTPNRILGEVVNMDDLRLLTPDLTWVLEIAHELLLLGIGTDDRVSCRLMLRSLFVDVLELSITVRMLCTGSLFHIGPQAIVMLLKQPTDHRQAYAVTQFIETLLNIRQATVEPFALAHRIPRCMG